MSRKKFYFNPDSHQFIEIRRTPGEKILRWSVFTITAVVLAVLTHNLLGRMDLNPGVTCLELQQERLLGQYDSLNCRLAILGNQLAEMQVRDDSLYRSVFSMDPIPRSVREAGLGGSNPYPLLLGFNSSDLMISTTRGLDILELKANIQLGSLNDLWGRALERKELLAQKPSIQPIPLDIYFWISSDFGYRTDPMTKVVTEHRGLDFAALRGTEVFSTGDGTVSQTKISYSGYGKEVIIDHGYGYTTRYAHLNTILVHVGQKVSRGSLIGILGSSGKSTGPHLHYEVRLYNKALNPRLFYADDLLPQEYRQITALANGSDN